MHSSLLRPNAPRFRRLWPHRAAPVIVAAVCAGASAAAAQQPAGAQPVQPAELSNAPAVTSPSPAFSPPVERLIADLASPLYAVRQQASGALAAREDLSLSDLESILNRPNLTAEQRVRIQALARERFATTPRGAMGVRFGGVLQQSRIVIDATYEGFNAHDVLKPGDVIIVAGGRQLRGDLGRHILRAMVFAHDPGDTIDIAVRRGAEKLDLTLRLGSFHVLAQQPQGRPLDDLDLARAWAMRMALQAERALGAGVEAEPDGAPAINAVLTGVAVEPITTTLPASQWPTTREQLEVQHKIRNARLYGDKGQITIAAGGQFREGTAGVNAADPGHQFAMVQPTHPLEVLTREPTIMPRERELTILSAIEVRTTEELNRLASMLENTDLRGLQREQRAQTEELVRQYRQRLEMIKMERAAIEAEQREQGDEDVADDRGPMLEQ